MNPYDPWRLPVSIGTAFAIVSQFFLAQRIARHETSPWVLAILGLNVLAVLLLLMLLLVATLFGD